VSDKPNAFTVIFNLFLAKLQDEQKRENDELEFHWRENDDAIEFQVRLHNLHKEGSLAFLNKKIVSIEDSDFGNKTGNELKEAKKKILKFTKVFDIKNVLDDDDFLQNQRVLKEVVQLIEKFQIRYPKKQKYLSVFFEKLLTIGLKQEVGQFFTPPPIAKFIIRSLPLPQLIKKELDNENPKLPAVIDYAAGSGHFLTEIMEEYQSIIENLDTSNFYPNAKKEVDAWKINQYSWASSYIYGIEKDYRLVKVAKVGCYFYGDGLAQVVHGDGLDCFEKSKTYRGLLKENAKSPQFSIVVANPPFKVNDCKDDLEYIYRQFNGKPNNFELYKLLTLKSDQIESLFVERTKHLLKEYGIAGIILPSSILSNTGIYTKTREIVLQYFDIIAITELGNNTFMATGTKTVVLFLRKRNENDVEKIKTNAYNNLEHYKNTKVENTTNGIEKPFSKYLEHTNETIENNIDGEKFYYFVLNYWQKTVIVKTGEKEAEKRFLGYEYSNRRGSEGMNEIQKGKTIEECTKLFDENDLENEEKASSYIYKAFNDDFDFPIHESLKENVSRLRLVDMLEFDRVKFEKIISTNVKKKEIDSKWETVKLGEILFENEKSKIKVGTAKDLQNGDYPFFTSGETVLKFNEYLIDNQNIYLSTGGNAVVKFYDGKAAYSTDTFVVRSNNENKIKTKFIFIYLESIISTINEFYFKGITLKHLQKPDFRNISIPLPSLTVQGKIVSEIEILEKKEKEAKEKIENSKEKINEIINNVSAPSIKISEIAEQLFAGGDLPKDGNYSLEKTEKYTIPIYANAIEKDGLYGYTDIIKVDKPCLTISARGTIGFTKIRTEPFYPIVRLLVLIPKEDIAMLKYLEYAIPKLNLNQFGANIPQLTVPQLSSFEIPLPSLSEQQKIVSEIEKIETEITELEQHLGEIPKQKETVLKKYL